MKKLSILLAIMLIFSSISSVAFADTTAGGNGNLISISFKVGDEILKINGNEVKVVKPYVVNGNTLVPLRVITEAFGAEVVWEASDRSITIIYEDTTILLKLDNNEAVINDQKVTMAVTPVSVNGTTMVPLRFITENFGAEVTYDNATKLITVTKEISNGGITDFSDLLKRSNKERVGDSYYKWSIELPEEFEFSTRSFNGSTSMFSTPDSTAFLYVIIEDNEDKTLEHLWREAADDSLNSGETILENKIVDINGTKFERIISKDYDGIYEMRQTIYEDKIYSVILIVYDNTLKNTDAYKQYLDSFKTVFTDAAITDDISDVDENGYRTYKNENFKYSFKVPAEWRINSSDDTNIVNFYDINGTSENWDNELTFRMYSKGSVLSLDDMIAKEKQYIADEYNPALAKVVSTQKQTINGIQCATITESFKFNDETLYYITTYAVGKNYRYELELSIAGADYNKTNYKTVIDYVTKSLEITEPSVEEAGSLYDPTEVYATGNMYKVTADDKKWSFEVPINWDSQNSYGSSSMYEYIDPGHQMSFTFVESERTAADLVKSYEEYSKAFEASGDYKVISKEVLYEKGATVYKYVDQNTIGNTTITEYNYIISIGGKTYLAVLEIEEIRKSAKNLKLINDIWNSITFY